MHRIFGTLIVASFSVIASHAKAVPVDIVFSGQVTGINDFASTPVTLGSPVEISFSYETDAVRTPVPGVFLDLFTGGSFSVNGLGPFVFDTGGSINVVSPAIFSFSRGLQDDAMSALVSGTTSGISDQAVEMLDDIERVLSGPIDDLARFFSLSTSPLVTGDGFGTCTGFSCSITGEWDQVTVSTVAPPHTGPVGPPPTTVPIGASLPLALTGLLTMLGLTRRSRRV